VTISAEISKEFPSSKLLAQTASENTYRPWVKSLQNCTTEYLQRERLSWGIALWYSQ